MMIARIVLGMLLVLAGPAGAEEKSVDVKDTVAAMKKELDLTNEQAGRVTSIVRSYFAARQEYMDSIEGMPIIDRKALRAKMKELKQQQYQQLGKVLDERQMKKWVTRENLRARLNTGVSGFQVDQGASITTNGADFRF